MLQSFWTWVVVRPMSKDLFPPIVGENMNKASASSDFAWNQEDTGTVSRAGGQVLVGCW